jgi:undecaprenyl-phosphate 4-deoxy-4-formamido-L-arabinose transferase
MSHPPACALSFVIPLYNSAQTIRPLVQAIEALTIEGGHEVILVNDGSRDETATLCHEIVRMAKVPVTFVNHARNYGEHNAVLSGYREARGAHVVNLDDDGQNPPAEAVRLWRHAVATGHDAVFGHYRIKQHSLWRNFGSWFTNRVTDLALDKPPGFYLSSFRCVTAMVAREVSAHQGPFPYVDGLILQVTQNLGSLEVEHAARQAGRSGYTMRRLLRLWVSAWVNFSVLPLRIATLLGLLTAAAGLVGVGVVVWLKFSNAGPAFGWGSLMAGLMVFSGVQLVMLGLLGEYLGRMFLTINRRPQSVVREVVRSGG